ncbi:unnamed protein product [Cochlearia groenlandica]
MSDGDEPISKDVRRRSFSNAEEKRMKLGLVDGLSELVWSPRNGLSLRCANFSFTGKPQLLSPNHFDHHIALQQQSSNNMDQGTTTSTSIQQQQQEACNEINRPFSGLLYHFCLIEYYLVCLVILMRVFLCVCVCVCVFEEMKSEREDIGEDKVETNDDIGSEDTDKRTLDCRKAGDLLANDELRLEAVGSQEEATKTNIRVLDDNCLEATDENDLATNALEAEKDVDKAGPSDRAKAKGKGKALSDGRGFDDDGDDDDDKSFGSVESCNSTGLLLKGKKRPGFDQQHLIIGSKRLKTLSQQECLGSTSKLKQDSSFMNWISNMTKGIWTGNEEDNPSPGQVNAIVDNQEQCCLKENSGCRNTGFQSFFQSIYCPKKKSQEAVGIDSPNDATLKKLPWIPEKQCLITEGEHLSSSGNENGPVAEPPNNSSAKVGFDQTSKTFSSKNKEPNISLLSLSESKPNEEKKACGDGEVGGKVIQCLRNRNSGLDSLWISRFSSKSSFANETAKETNESHKVVTDNNVIIPSTSKIDRFDNPKTILPIVSSMRVESSEAMASLLARRLEAMKHMMPSSSLAEDGNLNLICFFCGKKGHRLQDCLEVTDTELRDLVQNISARDGKEEASSLCIRCFQLSHWAATCPNTPIYSSAAEDRVTKHALASTSGTKLPSLEAPKAVFEAIQVLRLTRTDVLKWINTKKSVSGLEGFFLRIRLGKWEAGLGGTGYYVARIDESQSSRRNSDNNNSISVMVGGMTCFVESQFISNHDFLQEELKAWWRSAGKGGGGGDGIPSAEELSRKIQQRKMLGF